MPRTIGLHPNVAGFLDALAFSEIGPDLLACSDDGYNVLVGSTPGKPLLFPSYTAHPDVLDRALDSTAAGRYQLIHPTWAALRGRLRLADFSPASQDAAAIDLIRERNALSLAESGHFTAAVIACSAEWASLPGSLAGQHQQKLADLQAAYFKAGGVLAGAAFSSTQAA